ncbi:MAG: Valine-tRNA ligase [Candidatus Uhrbacteria bacterium GW2011_GWE2_45_35]|uniref:Valine-tRNA ligase n=2 Tax=Candidatus Uhriibacteriota TaxID=1752732 RepID=A0A0G1JFX3_9BACT|nr:MAG: Valine-tRNA ligase [Candidatus Uhrbacteria bacterium GW2011_GWF2_44_350]KKU06882.1 MAG: Valine-tRNA ligase [Candidatus Uhrbacteria bacterium GW2011_GWE2_45_35]HBR81013.1 hypothetical protein [Candidatus Uhrbacteria bacterium]HCU32076.1 hypothetical protein [Candidatus Uhrbacteria bacterium]
MLDRPSINKLNQKNVRQFLRRNQTDAEAILWQYLRRKETGEKIVRQYGIENYVVDFCRRSKKLIIEIDGEIHNEKDVAENDKLRTQDLENLGYKIIRFTNQEVLNDLESVINKIKTSLK